MEVDVLHVELRGEFLEEEIPEGDAHCSLTRDTREDPYPANLETHLVIIHRGSPTPNFIKALLEDRSARALFVSRGGGVNSQIEHLKRDPSWPDRVARERVWGAVEKIEKLREHWAGIMDFIRSGRSSPEDLRAARFLGFDFPVRRLAIALAIEVVRREDGLGSLSADDVLRFLAPAIDLGAEIPALESLAQQLSAEVVAAPNQAERMLAYERCLMHLTTE